MLRKTLLVLCLISFASCSDDIKSGADVNLGSIDDANLKDFSLDVSVKDAVGDMPSKDGADMRSDTGENGKGTKCASWKVETIFPIAGHETTDAGGSSDLVFDKNGFAHVSFSTNLGLYYGTNASGVWDFEQIPSPRPISATAIAINPQGRVDIVYYEGENFDLRQATNATGSWITTLIAGQGVVGEDLTMTTDAQNRLHISYLGARSALIYGVRNGDTWTLEEVEADTYGRPTPSIIIRDSFPLISFGSYREGLFFTSRASGSWVKETVVSGFDIGGSSSLAKAADGTLHISYREHKVDAGKLYYATNANGEWTTQTLDTNNDAGWNTSLLERDGTIHIVHTSSLPSGELRYTSRDSSGWSTSIISQSKSYARNSLKFDPSGKIAVSFQQSANALGFARCE